MSLPGRSESCMDAEPVTGGVDPHERNTPQRRSADLPGFIAKISKREFDSKFYRVNSGRVLVLNNKEFQVPGLADRTGSDLDASVICQRFQDIGFEYDLEGDMTKNETFTWFEKAKTEMTTTPVDCFVLVLLSHGREDGIYARDSIMQFADIIEIFNATNCPQLRFKPKVLIIQCCRGSNLCLGVNVRVDPNQADSKADYSDYNEQLEIQKIRLPNEADFLFAYAAVPGTGAFRDGESGSPFIRHLSNAMENMEVNEDFYSVLTTVNKTVGLTYQPRNETLQLNKVVQMPCFVSHLTKVLRLKQRA